MVAQCDTCKTTIVRQESWMTGKRHFCNKECHIKFQSTLRGEETNNWRGGLKFNCKTCSKECIKQKMMVIPKYCSIKCASADKAQGLKGEKHHNWKGGIDVRYIKSTAPRPRPEICEVCGKLGKKRNGICLDHNHKTMKFRGWLCSNCNTAIGLVQEDKNILLALIKYLEADENHL